MKKCLKIESVCIMSINEKLALDSQADIFISHCLFSPQQCLAVLPAGSSHRLTDSAAPPDTRMFLMCRLSFSATTDTCPLHGLLSVLATSQRSQYLVFP